MTNEEKMKTWTGGNWKEIPVFSDYSYENCLAGVSTDGRAVYSFDSAIDFLYEACKEEYDANDFKNQEDMEYAIRLDCASMLNDDLGFIDSSVKSPVFFRELEDPSDLRGFKLIKSSYDFSECIIGEDFREDRIVYSLSKMIQVIVKKDECTELEAKGIVYGFKSAGKVTDDGDLFYIIVDDRFDLGKPVIKEKSKNRKKVSSDPGVLEFDFEG